MFRILKLFIWISVLLVVAYFALGYSSYQLNLNYFEESKQACRQRMRDCSESLIHKGIDNAECDPACVESDLIIKKK